MFIKCTYEIIGYETENNFHRLIIMCLKFASIKIYEVFFETVNLQKSLVQN